MKECEIKAEVALRFLRVLDTNSDGAISPAEWQAAWQSGDFQLRGASSSPGKKINYVKPKLTSKYLSSSTLIQDLSPGDTNDTGKKGKNHLSKEASSKKVLPSISGKKSGGMQADAPAPAPSISETGSAKLS